MATAAVPTPALRDRAIAAAYKRAEIHNRRLEGKVLEARMALQRHASATLGLEIDRDEIKVAAREPLVFVYAEIEPGVRLCYRGAPEDRWPLFVVCEPDVIDRVAFIGTLADLGDVLLEIDSARTAHDERHGIALLSSDEEPGWLTAGATV